MGCDSPLDGAVHGCFGDGPVAVRRSFICEVVAGPEARDHYGTSSATFDIDDLGPTT